MTSKENPYELIDRYLLGELEGEEKLAFEKKIAQNRDLSDELEQQKVMISVMDEHATILENNPVQDTPSEQKRKKLKKYQSSRKNRILSTIGIAFSISVITFISTLYITNRKAIKVNLEKSKAFTQLEDRITTLEKRINNSLASNSKSPTEIDDKLYVIHLFEDKVSYLEVQVIESSKISLEIQSDTNLKIGQTILNEYHEVVGIISAKNEKTYSLRLIDRK